jgi:DNA invertase Pin-like site-specific DNA recombinase
MTQTLIGYARCSTDKQDLAAQHDALLKLGVAADRIYTDKGFTGTNRTRPGLDQALAAVRSGDTLVVPKLDRLARSVPDARAIGDDLAARGVKLQLGASVHDPADPMGKLFFNILATFAEFEADLIRMRTREGMAVARAKGKLRGKKPKLSDRQQKELRRMYDTGDYSISDLAELFSISKRPTCGHRSSRSACSDGCALDRLGDLCVGERHVPPSIPRCCVSARCRALEVAVGGSPAIRANGAGRSLGVSLSSYFGGWRSGPHSGRERPRHTVASHPYCRRHANLLLREPCCKSTSARWRVKGERPLTTPFPSFRDAEAHPECGTAAIMGPVPKADIPLSPTCGRRLFRDRFRWMLRVTGAYGCLEPGL